MPVFPVSIQLEDSINVEIKKKKNFYRQPQVQEQKQRSTPGEKLQGHHLAV